MKSVFDNVRSVRIRVTARQYVWIGLAVLAACLTSSCGGSGTATPNAFKASLTFSSSSVDFGGVSVGSSKTNTITVSNASETGSPSITVSQVSVTGAAFSAATTPVWPFSLEPGQSASLVITFSPKSSGTANGTLTVSVEGSTPATVNLTGDGLAAGQLSVSPTALNFGNVTVGNSKNLTGTLSAGAADVTVSSASWNGNGYSVSGITFPVTVLAGKSKTFTVTFAPQTTGTSAGQVSFVSDATNSPTAETFTGTGTQAAQHSVSLTWNASTSQVIGYYIYRSTTPGSYGAPLNGTPQSGLTYTDSTVSNGTTYFYVVTAVDSHSQQSAYSNEATAIIP
jgi:Abnormal spindle-like microcephaly-assoc'd, ASPM-SPD-2-Hydin